MANSDLRWYILFTNYEQGLALRDLLLQNNFGGKFRTRTVPDRFLAHASVDEIFDDLGLTGEKLAEWIGEELR